MKESTKRILEMPSSMTCKEVAEKLGLTYNQVISARRANGVQYAKKSAGRVTDHALMFKQIEDGIPYPEIAAQFNMTPQSIRHHAAKIGHSRRVKWPDEAIAKDYAAGMRMKKMEAKYGCSNQIILAAAKRVGVPIRRRGYDAANAA
jgi:DNA-binding CsgD family transcriptional regulator